jgi:23S rRNA pseudouridine2605 synthase
MAFNKPENGRGDRSRKPSNSAPRRADDAKRYSSQGREKSSGSERASSDHPFEKFSKRGEKRPSSSPGSRAPRSSGSANEGGFNRGEKKFGGPKPGTPQFGSKSSPNFKKRDDSSGDRAASPYRKREDKPYDGRPKLGEASFYKKREDSTGDRPSTGYKKREGDSSERKPSTGFKRREGDSSERKPSTGYKKREGDSFERRPASTYKKRDDSFGDRPYKAAPKRDFDRSDAPPVRKLRSKRATSTQPSNDGLIRLNRYIANAGICSRRKADELIEAGTVTVNGEVVTELGSKVDPIKDQIRYNGEMLKREKNVYVLLNKPKDYITTTDDPQERRTVMHLVEKASRERIYPIGRLDRNTTGLLLMTNDGDLADKLSHPRSNVVKLYQVELTKPLAQGDLNKIQFGVELEDGLIKPDAVSYVAGGTKREIGIQIHSGKNRIVRRIFEHLGYEVVKLDRVVYAGLTKKDLPRGRWRYLEEKEVIQLKHLIK